MTGFIVEGEAQAVEAVAKIGQLIAVASAPASRSASRRNAWLKNTFVTMKCFCKLRGQAAYRQG